MLKKAHKVIRHIVHVSKRLVKKSAHVTKKVAKKAHVKVTVNHKHCKCGPKKPKVVIKHHKKVVVKPKYVMKPFRVCKTVMRRVRVGGKVWKAHKWVKSTKKTVKKPLKKKVTKKTVKPTLKKKTAKVHVKPVTKKLTKKPLKKVTVHHVKPL